MSKNNTNVVILDGRITKDCVVTKYEKTPKASVTFSLAVNSTYKDKAGTYHDDVSYFDVEYWTKNPAYFQDNFKKGAFVQFTGSAKQKRWEKDGHMYSKVVFIADRLSVLDVATKKATEQSAAVEIEADDEPFENFD